MFFFNKKSRENEASELFIEHAGLVGETLVSMERTIDLYMAGGDYVPQSKHTHEVEHQADELAARIRAKLYEGAFLQGLRGDFAAMLGKMEKVAGHAVIVCRILCEEKPDIPAAVKGDILAMGRKTVEASPHLSAAFKALDTEIAEIAAPCKALDTIESEVDAILHQLLTKLYAQEIELARKIQIKDLLIYLHRISDFAAEFANVIHILAMNLRI